VRDAARRAAATGKLATATVRILAGNLRSYALLDAALVDRI
jgi:hypothetical protein